MNLILQQEQRPPKFASAIAILLLLFAIFLIFKHQLDQTGIESAISEEDRVHRTIESLSDEFIRVSEAYRDQEFEYVAGTRFQRFDKSIEDEVAHMKKNWKPDNSEYYVADAFIAGNLGVVLVQNYYLSTSYWK